MYISKATPLPILTVLLSVKTGFVPPVVISVITVPAGIVVELLGSITKSPIVTAEEAPTPMEFTSISLLIEAACVVSVAGDIGQASCLSVKPGVSITKSSGNPDPKTSSPTVIVEVID